MANLRKNIFLGVDGGGTKTQAVLVDSQGKVIAKGQASGSNPAIFGIGKSLDNIYLSAQIALKNFPDAVDIPTCLAIAGVNTEKEAKIFLDAVLSHPTLSKIISKNSIVVNDTQAALRAGTNDNNAIVVIAGTGSNCFGINDKGKTEKSGGRDFILSDEGRAYAIGLSTLKTVTKASDGRTKDTILKNLLFDYLKINSIDGLTEIVNKRPWNKTDIAKVAPLVEEAAKRGDRQASEIIKTAAMELALMIKAVAEKLDLKNKEYTIVTTGSVFNIAEMKRLVREKVLEFNPGVEIIQPKISSAYGAALLAKEQN